MENNNLPVRAVQGFVSIFRVLCVSSVVWGASIVPGGAQVMPGMRAPTDLVDAAVIAVTGGCWLASSGRPIYGINVPAEGNAGAGLKEHSSAPAWVQKASAAPGRSRFSTLKNPEGDLWIRFDESTSRCSVITRPKDIAKFRSAFADALMNGRPEFSRENAADGSETIVRATPTFDWKSRVSNPPGSTKVVLIETTFARK